jgi:hypothetical protein
MCHDMRRFEKMAEESKHVKKENAIEFVINKPDFALVATEAEGKEPKNKKHP